MKKLYLPTIAILLFAFGFTMLQTGKHQQLTQMRLAYGTCWHSSTVNDRRAEIACANAQDATHTEFVCGQMTCWLEVK